MCVQWSADVNNEICNRRRRRPDERRAAVDVVRGRRRRRRRRGRRRRGGGGRRFRRRSGESLRRRARRRRASQVGNLASSPPSSHTHPNHTHTHSNHTHTHTRIATQHSEKTRTITDRSPLRRVWCVARQRRPHPRVACIIRISSLIQLIVTVARQRHPRVGGRARRRRARARGAAARPRCGRGGRGADRVARGRERSPALTLERRKTRHPECPRVTTQTQRKGGVTCRV